MCRSLWYTPHKMLYLLQRKENTSLFLLPSLPTQTLANSHGKRRYSYWSESKTVYLFCIRMKASQEGRDFCIFYLLMCVQVLEQYLVYNVFLTNVCWVNKKVLKMVANTCFYMIVSIYLTVCYLKVGAISWLLWTRRYNGQCLMC